MEINMNNILICEEKLKEVYYLGNIEKVALGIAKSAKQIEYKEKKVLEYRNSLNANQQGNSLNSVNYIYTIENRFIAFVFTDLWNIL